VIPPEQLAGALERLDPRERELLALSLRRRVPDEALARVYDVVPQEVARRRAAAIERLADELGAQRGEDLGAVLQALLDEGTWRITVGMGAEEGPETELDAKKVLEAEAERAAAPAPAAQPEESEPPPAPEAAEEEPKAEGAEAEAAEPEAEETEPEPQAAEPEAKETEPEAAEPDAAPPKDAPQGEAAPEPQPEAARREPTPVEQQAAVVPVASEPVLEMLAAREGIRGPEAEQPADGESRARRGPVVAAVLGSFAAAVIGGAAAFVGLSEWGDDAASSSAAEPAANETMKHFVPELGGPFEAPFPSEPQPITCFSIASTTGKTTLYEKPGGKRRITLSPRTEWGSPRILGVVRRRGDWVSVQAPELGNGEVAWMPANRARLDCVRWSMHVDLSRRRLSVERDGNTVRRFEIAVGRKGNPTPEGRFSVTDKLRVTDPGSPYGCCVLALTGHQTHLPASWPGGDRLAVHATRELSSLGRAASLGCMRVTSTQARWLIKTIPLGAPLYVRA
jgi:L,D-transpeptidase-like protein